MQKFMKKRKARGFTLVELLIVIIIIGILAGALLLVAGAGTDKAEATKIVSNLRGMKAAAIMLYADYNDWTDVPASLGIYMEQNPPAGYVVSKGYVGFESVDVDGVDDKLAAMADAGGVALYSDTTCSADYTADNATVYMPLN